MFIDFIVIFYVKFLTHLLDFYFILRKKKRQLKFCTVCTAKHVQVHYKQHNLRGGFCGPVYTLLMLVFFFILDLNHYQVPCLLMNKDAYICFGCVSPRTVSPSPIGNLVPPVLL